MFCLFTDTQSVRIPHMFCLTLNIWINTACWTLVVTTNGKLWRCCASTNTVNRTSSQASLAATRHPKSIRTSLVTREMMSNPDSTTKTHESLTLWNSWNPDTVRTKPKTTAETLTKCSAIRHKSLSTIWNFSFNQSFFSSFNQKARLDWHMVILNSFPDCERSIFFSNHRWSFQFLGDSFLVLTRVVARRVAWLPLGGDWVNWCVLLRKSGKSFFALGAKSNSKETSTAHFYATCGLCFATKTNFLSVSESQSKLNVVWLTGTLLLSENSQKCFVVALCWRLKDLIGLVVCRISHSVIIGVAPPGSLQLLTLCEVKAWMKPRIQENLATKRGITMPRFANLRSQSRVHFVKL